MRGIVLVCVALSWPLGACVDVDAGLKRQAAFDLGCQPEQLTVSPLQREGVIIKSQGVTGCGRKATYVLTPSNVWVMATVNDGREIVVTAGSPPGTGSHQEIPVPECPISPVLSSAAPGYRTSCDGGVLGGLSKDVIRAEIQTHNEVVRQCYWDLLAKTAIEGDLKLRWVIGSDGRVQSTCVAHATPELPRSLVACVAERVAEFRFPPPTCGGIVTVTYPWLFRMAQDGGTSGNAEDRPGQGV
jgi:hypothetical protein